MIFVILTNQHFLPNIICRKYPYLLSKRNIEVVACEPENGGRTINVLTIDIIDINELDELVKECHGRIELVHRESISRNLIPVIYLN